MGENRLGQSVSSVVVYVFYAILGLFFVGFIVSFVGPEFTWLAEAFGWEMHSRGKAINSAKGLALATSCTAIINSKGKSDPIFYDEWTTPMNAQGFGSSIPFSCQNAVPKPGEPPKKRGVWFDKPQENGVHVVCQSYNRSSGGCYVENFALPEKIPYVGPDTGPQRWAQKTIRGLGMPQWVLYYQRPSQRAMGGWLARAKGISMTTIAITAAIELGFLGAAGFSSLAKGSDEVASAGTVSKYKDEAGKLINSKARSFSEGVADMFSIGSRVEVGPNTLRARARRTLKQSDSYKANAGLLAAQYARKAGRAFIKLGDTGLSLAARPVGTLFDGGRWLIRFMGRKAGGFVMHRFADAMPPKVVAKIALRNGDDFFYDVARRYRRSMARKLQDSDLMELQQPADAVQGQTIGQRAMADDLAIETEVSDEVFKKQYKEMVEESMENAIRKTGDEYFAKGTVPIDGDQMLRLMRRGDMQKPIDQFAEQQAGIMVRIQKGASEVSQSMAVRGDGSALYANSMTPNEWMNYVVRAEMAGEQLASQLLTPKTAKGISKTVDKRVKEFVGKYAPRLEKLYRTNPKFAKSIMGLKRLPRRTARGGARVGKGVARTVGGAASLVCSNPMLMSKVVKQVSQQIDNNAAASFVKGVGRCYAVPAAMMSMGKYCGRSGIQYTRGTRAYKAAHGTLINGKRMCAAMSTVAYYMSKQASQMMMSGTNKLNSFYLQQALGGRTEIPLHPVANWYMVQLKKDRNPDSRFFLASPFQLNGVLNAGKNPRLKVRGGVAEMRVASRMQATDKRRGPGKNKCKSLLNLANRAVHKAANSIEGGLKAISFGFLKFNGCPLINNNKQVKLRDALACGVRGTFRLRSGRWEGKCGNNLMYTKYPQVRRIPGSGYPRTPALGAGSALIKNPVPVTFLNSTIIRPSNQRLKVQKRGVNVMDMNHSQVPPSEFDNPSEAFTAESLVIPQAQMCSDGVVVAYCNDVVSTPLDRRSDCTKVTIGDERGESLTTPTQVNFSSPQTIRSAGIKCDRPGGGARVAAERMSYKGNVQFIKGVKPSSGRIAAVNAFNQLWYWNDPHNDGDCKKEGHCRFSWQLATAPDPYIHNTSDRDPAMRDMYPVVAHEAWGTTRYVDPNAVGTLWSKITGIMTINKESKVKEMNSIQIRVKGLHGGNWKTKAKACDRNSRCAVYGFNADINANAIAKAAVLTIGLALEALIIILSGGILAEIAVASFNIIGTVTTQFLSYKTSWPNH